MKPMKEKTLKKKDSLDWYVRKPPIALVCGANQISLALHPKSLSIFYLQTMSRNEKKDIRRRTADASRLDNFNDIGDIGEFEELAELSKGVNKSKKGSSAESLSEEGTHYSQSNQLKQ